MLYKIREVRFRLLDTNGFVVKAKNERFTAAGSRCRQNLKYENFMSSFGRPRQKVAPKSVPYFQDDYSSTFNQSNHWFVVLLLPLPSSFLKLVIVELGIWYRPLAQIMHLGLFTWVRLTELSRLPRLQKIDKNADVFIIIENACWPGSRDLTDWNLEIFAFNLCCMAWRKKLRARWLLSGFEASNQATNFWLLAPDNRRAWVQAIRPLLTWSVCNRATHSLLSNTSISQKYSFILQWITELTQIFTSRKNYR